MAKRLTKAKTPDQRASKDGKPAIAALVVAGLVVLVLITFGQLFTADFTSWDDLGTIVENPWFNPPTARGLAAAWTQPRMDLWIPATYTLWWGVAQIAWNVDPATGQAMLSPVPFHALNIVVHAVSVCAVFFLLRRLKFPLLSAAIGAALFGLHPVQVESVGWVSGLKDLLFACFSLIALNAYLVAVEDRPSAWPRLGWYAVAAISLVIALLAKPTAVVVPMIAFVLDWGLLKRPLWNVLRTVVPLFVLAIPIVIVTKLVQPVHHGESDVPLLYRPLIALDAIAFYFGKLLVPLNLANDYGRSPVVVRESGSLYWTWIFPVAVACLVAWAWRRRNARVPAIAFAVFVLGMLPVLGLVRFDFQNLSTVSDHYLYLPMLGAALFVAWAVARVKLPVVWVGVCLVLILLAIRSANQTQHWQGTQALFEHTLSVNPDSFAAVNSLAALAEKQGRPDQSLPLAERAFAMRPFDVHAQVTLGAAYASTGQLEKALDLYRKAYASHPDEPAVLNNLSGLLAQMGKLDEAMPIAKKAVDSQPNSSQAHFNYGTMLAQTNRVPEGLPHLAEAVRLAPQNIGARRNYAMALSLAGRKEEAKAQFDVAMQMEIKSRGPGDRRPK